MGWGGVISWGDLSGFSLCVLSVYLVHFSSVSLLNIYFIILDGPFRGRPAMFWCRCRVPAGCCSLGSSVFSGHLQISLLVWPLDWWDVPYCMDVVGSHFWFGRGFGSSAASFFGRFVTAPSSCASYTPSILGVGRVVMYSESLISDLPWWVQSCYIFCGLCI